MSGPANGEGHRPAAQAKRGSWGNPLAGTRRGPNHPTFQGRLGRISLPKESPVRASASKRSPPRSSSGQATPRLGLQAAFWIEKGSADGPGMPRLRKPTARACWASAAGPARHAREAAVYGKSRYRQPVDEFGNGQLGLGMRPQRWRIALPPDRLATFSKAAHDETVKRGAHPCLTSPMNLGKQTNRCWRLCGRRLPKGVSTWRPVASGSTELEIRYGKYSALPR